MVAWKGAPISRGRHCSVAERERKHVTNALSRTMLIYKSLMSRPGDLDAFVWMRKIMP
jgi:hypothetical protein